MLKEDQLTVVEIYGCEVTTKQKLSLYSSNIKAGFPSPADDFLDKKLDLNEFLIEHPSSTFFVKVKGDSMINAGIHSGDILIVDRSLEPKHNNIVVAIINGEFTVKRLAKKGSKVYLISANPEFKPIEVNSTMDFEIWGVVHRTIHSV